MGDYEIRERSQRLGTNPELFILESSAFASESNYEFLLCFFTLSIGILIENFRFLKSSEFVAQDADVS